MPSLRTLLVFFLVQGLATESRGEEQTWRPVNRYRRRISGQDFGPTEEGTRIFRTCATRTDAHTAGMVWQMQLAAGTNKTVAKCETSQVGLPYRCTLSSPVFSRDFNIMEDQTQITLTWNADRRFLSVACSQSEIIIGNWTLVTYSKPKDLTCSGPEFTNKNNTVSVTCVTSDIFPEHPRCVLYNHRSPVKTSLPPSYGRDTARPSCTFTIQASELGAGTHRLSVNMYPQFDGSGENYGVTITISPDVTFSYPVPEFVNCPSGAQVKRNFIMSGSTATCGCRQKTPGFPQGTVVLSQGGSTLGSGTIASGSVVNPGNNNESQRLTCRSKSSLGQASPSVSKIVQFAYGPEDVTLERKNVRPEESGTYNMCPSATPDITMECSVKIVSPVADFTLTMTPPGTQNIDSCRNTENKCSYIFVPSRGGNHDFQCNAVNRAFGDLSRDSPPVHVYVREPPKTAPTLIIEGKTFTGASAGNIIGLEAGTEHSVECHVDGGFPEISASDISLQCGGRDVTDGKFVPPLLSVCLNETSCSCRAEHPSGCYDLTTEVIVFFTGGGTNGEKLEQGNDDQETIAIAVGTALASFALGCVSTVAMYCLLSRKGWLHKKSNKCSRSGIPKEKKEPDSDGLPYEFSDLHLNDMAFPNQHDDTRRGTGNPTEASANAGRQEESPYSYVDSDYTLLQDVKSDFRSSQDIHTPGLIGKTMAETIPPEAPQARSDGRCYDNLAVTSSVSKAGLGGQGQTHNPGTYDVLADPASGAFASDPYMTLQPEAEYSIAGAMDGPSSSP
ncbi:uncharacterized protein LOC101859384 isoform X2 [Aplysia californica]|uniref:Uncharacterized protein LOC101859384 isoform X2 n=1 Tax=Aplysia californica TaxID=6500 RepID=A0ABM1AFS3_APLCA|nr:uncharacterized protein LOC101859384 isoform X2 [Aplysia californica]